MLGINDLSDLKMRFVLISISTKNIRVEELTSQEGILQSRVITLIVSEQKYLEKSDRLETWNNKGKLAFFDTINKTVIYSPAIKQKLQEAAQGNAQIRFVQQQGNNLIDLDWQVKDDEGEAFTKILAQQRSGAPFTKKSSAPLKGDISLRKETLSLKERIRQSKAASDRQASKHERQFYLKICQMTIKIQAANQTTREELDKTNKDEAKHSEKMREQRHQELKKTAEKKDLSKANDKRTKEHKVEKIRVPGTSLDAQKEPPTTAHKST